MLSALSMSVVILSVLLVSFTFYLSLDCHLQFFLYLWIIVEEILHLGQCSSISSILSKGDGALD